MASYWFTFNGEFIPQWKIRQYIYDYYEEVEVQKIVWDYIIHKAQAGNNFKDIIDSDPDHPIHDAIKELYDEGYNCGGGTTLTTYGLGVVADILYSSSK